MECILKGNLIQKTSNAIKIKLNFALSLKPFLYLLKEQKIIGLSIFSSQELKILNVFLILVWCHNKIVQKHFLTV